MEDHLLTHYRALETSHLQSIVRDDLTSAAQNALDQVLAERAEETNDTTASTPEHAAGSGVGGWLLFLVVILFAGPLLGMGFALVEINNAERLHQALSELDSWRLYKILDGTIRVVQFAICVWAAWSLMHLRTTVAVFRAQLALWSGPVAVLLIAAVLPTLLFGATKTDEMLGHISSSFVPAFIWTLYLSFSKRVKATYDADKTPITPES